MSSNDREQCVESNDARNVPQQAAQIRSLHYFFARHMDVFRWQPSMTMLQACDRTR
jgi:hypothetical protein